MTGLQAGISTAGSAADTSRAFGGWGLPAADVAYRIIAKLHYVRYMFTFWSERVNGGQLARTVGISVQKSGFRRVLGSYRVNKPQAHRGWPLLQGTKCATWLERLNSLILVAIKNGMVPRRGQADKLGFSLILLCFLVPLSAFVWHICVAVKQE
ncbi:hypothetical protein [Rhizobium ruizarguesonis]|uniref:hypothetical protein n=1 Tax=Rhizobium ruizarguesonis TaxID=2081791 RepID=UPI001444D1B8|nr:hypothetical protein [Rhizobium ruizarguesonis]